MTIILVLTDRCTCLRKVIRAPRIRDTIARRIDVLTTLTTWRPITRKRTLFFLAVVLTASQVALSAAEPVTKEINLLEVIKSGGVDYHINPQSDVHDDPKEVWSVQPDGILRVSGRGYGYVATKENYRDYHLMLEFKWGEKTWGHREQSARDNGILLHAHGPHGAFGGTWMASIECQIIEGGTGDILVLSPKLADGMELISSLSAEFALDRDKEMIWKKGEPRKKITSGRVNWEHRDVDWADKKGFRGKADVEHPPGEWNRLEVIAKGDTLQYFLNGVVVNEAFDAKPSEGKILLQTEGAEMFVRRYELHPLGQFKAQLPASPLLRVAGLNSAQALKSFESLDGFEMQLVAAEPDVLEPIVVTYDENGVMFVAEYLKFPTLDGNPDHSSDPNSPDGQIRLLRDRDGDGRYENAKVFADGIAWPTGLCPWKGGVFVIAAPDLWYLKDTDGDDVADVREKLFTGFGFRNEEGTANNLIWGLDGWIYGAGSNSGGEVRPADKPDATPVSMSGCDFRLDPVSRRLEAISGSEQFGNTFDDWNNRFICSNSKPAVHVVLPANYLVRNPYLPVPRVIRDIWGDGNRVFRASPLEGWRQERTKLRLAMNQKWDPASVAHDVFTACTGVTVYRGAAYPEQYRGNLFVADVQSNIIHRRIVRPAGVSFVSVRADADTEMVRSKDNWLRPANLVNAPDGTLHVVDMYREVIETPVALPPEITARLDLHSGHDRGRIYRLAPPKFKIPPPPQLGSASIAALVHELENPNGWWRDTAQRLIHERQDRAAIEPLRNLLSKSASELGRLHALHALAGLTALTDADLTLALGDRSAGVREHAVRLTESRLKGNDQLLMKLLELANDDNPRLRFQVAFSLGEVNDPSAAETLARLARRNAADPWIRTAVLSSALNLSSEMIATLLDDEPFATSDAGRTLLRQLALVVGGRGKADEVKRLMDLLESSPAVSQLAVRRELILGLGDGLRRSRLSLRQFVQDSSAVKALLDILIRQSVDALAAESSSVAQRTQAIEILVHGEVAEVNRPLAAMLDSRQAPEVQLAAVHALAAFPEPEAATILIGAWLALSPAVRGEVTESLLARQTWIGPFLDALADKRIPAAHLDNAHRSRLLQHRDPAIRQRAAALLAGDVPSPRQEILADYRAALELPSDAAHGQKVFEKNCMTCHKLGTAGNEVGPNLATIQNRTPQELLTQILDPNREVQPNYIDYVITLDDGRVVTGLIAAESPTSLTIKRAENVQETILRQNIEEISSTAKSLMPEGLEKNISRQDISDLIAYLLRLKK